MKEMKLEIPADCEVDKIETQDGHIVVTFRKKERKLPKSWAEFCKNYPIQAGESYIIENGCIGWFNNKAERDAKNDKSMLPDRATAEAVLALIQLIQLRNCYNGDWVPDLTSIDTKWMIVFSKNTIETTICTYITASELYFKSEELRDEFLRYFRDLIEKLKPLYGIEEGGEE